MTFVPLWNFVQFFLNAALRIQYLLLLAGFHYSHRMHVHVKATADVLDTLTASTFVSDSKATDDFLEPERREMEKAIVRSKLTYSPVQAVSI